MKSIRKIFGYLATSAIITYAAPLLAQTGNTAYGTGALPSPIGSDNSAFGFDALAGDTSGNENTAVGSSALDANTQALRIRQFTARLRVTQPPEVIRLLDGTLLKQTMEELILRLVIRRYT